MISVSGFCDSNVRSLHVKTGSLEGGWVGGKQTFLVEDRLEDFLGRDEEVRHLPDGHFKVHLWELEETRHR